jgi:hypothetical protein
MEVKIEQSGKMTIYKQKRFVGIFTTQELEESVSKGLIVAINSMYEIESEALQPRVTPEDETFEQYTKRLMETLPALLERFGRERCSISCCDCGLSTINTGVNDHCIKMAPRLSDLYNSFKEAGYYDKKSK